MRLLLIRHGQTPSNVLGALDTGRPGPGLTALGEAQAAAIPAALADEKVDAIYASVLVRTQRTAAPLAAARGLEVAVVEGLEEIPAGVHEMKTERESVRAYVTALGTWGEGDLDHALEGGETGHAFLARFDAAVADIAAAHPDGTVVAVSHGAAIRVWAACRAQGVSRDILYRNLHNTGLCLVEGSPETGWELVRWVEDPLGGHELEDEAARDITGDSVD